MASWSFQVTAAVHFNSLFLSIACSIPPCCFSVHLLSIFVVKYLSVSAGQWVDNPHNKDGRKKEPNERKDRRGKRRAGDRPRENRWIENGNENWLEENRRERGTNEKRGEEKGKENSLTEQHARESKETMKPITRNNKSYRSQNEFQSKWSHLVGIQTKIEAMASATPSPSQGQVEVWNRLKNLKVGPLFFSVKPGTLCFLTLTSFCLCCVSSLLLWAFDFFL